MNMQVGNLLKLQDNLYEVAQDSVVQLRFSVSDAASGELLQAGDDLFYLHGGYGGAFPKVEQAMEGRRVGECLTVSLSPEESYGVRQPELVIAVPLESFAEARPEIGEAVDGQLPDGRSMTFTVAALDDERITLDGNHPFAGRQLDFSFEVLDIREAIEAERNAGFAFDGMF